MRYGPPFAGKACGARGQPHHLEGSVDPRPEITDSPAAKLQDGDVVTVTGSGFPAGAGVTVSQCVADRPTTADWCDGRPPVSASADATGAFVAAVSIALTFQRLLVTTATGPLEVSPRGAVTVTGQLVCDPAISRWAPPRSRHGRSTRPTPCPTTAAASRSTSTWCAPRPS